MLTISTVDYNSWVESKEGLKLASRLSKDVVLAEGMAFRPGFMTFWCLRWPFINISSC
jgi:hypothetical protein